MGEWGIATTNVYLMQVMVMACKLVELAKVSVPYYNSTVLAVSFPAVEAISLCVFTPLQCVSLLSPTLVRVHNH